MSHTVIAIVMSTLAQCAVQADLAYERLAHRLELVRNQIELTIANRRSLKNDIERQRRELTGLHVFARVPEASKDHKSDKALVKALRAELAKAAELKTGFTVKRVSLAGPWKSAARKVPATLPFDSDYRVPEDQVVDSRLVTFELVFDKDAPVDPSHWLKEQQDVVGRLIVPKSWRRSGKRLSGTALIYRFRELTYPKFTAPDLGRYQTPGEPRSDFQKAAHARIQRYRREIVALWPKAQPHVDDIREFARNDLRMNFFLKHANVH